MTVSSILLGKGDVGFQVFSKPTALAAKANSVRLGRGDRSRVGYISLSICGQGVTET